MFSLILLWELFVVLVSETMSCSVAQSDLEFEIFCLSLTSAGIMVICHQAQHFDG